MAVRFVHATFVRATSVQIALSCIIFPLQSTMLTFITIYQAQITIITQDLISVCNCIQMILQNAIFKYKFIKIIQFNVQLSIRLCSAPYITHQRIVYFMNTVNHFIKGERKKEHVCTHTCLPYRGMLSALY